MLRRVLLSASILLVACGDPAAPLATTEDTASTSTTSAGPPTTTDPSTGADPPTTGGPDGTTTAPAEPTCCGCLCIDPGWSCALDTCLYDDGTVATLAPEAGFLTLAPYAVSHFAGGEEVVQHTPEARIWYAFRPADQHPETRPLVVFFNGGPGYSSAVLFGFNTNAVTLDPDVAGADQVIDNPHRWTRFANVLYIDPRQAGYSYDLEPPGEDPPDLRFTPEQDASDFIQLVLAFLARHPQIQRNPVVLVGESYGGNRATLMLNQVLHPERLVGGGRYRDPTLHDALLAHFAKVFPEVPAADLTPQVLAAQFGHQVLIQPALTWLVVPGTAYTPTDERPAALECIPEHDVAQCDEPADWSFARSREVVSTITDPNYFKAAFGVDVTTIAWMYADARTNAIPRGKTGSTHDESGLRAVFGELPPDEPYYNPYNYPKDSAYAWENSYYGTAYLESMFFARTFITDAGKDLVVYAPDIPAYLAAYADVVAAAVHDKAPTPGEDRPGWIRLDYVPALVPGEPTRDIRFPHYPIAGHVVTHKQGAELATDVCRWLALDCPI